MLFTRYYYNYLLFTETTFLSEIFQCSHYFNLIPFPSFVMYKRHVIHYYNTCTQNMMELLIGVVVGVLIVFVTFYLTRRVTMVEKQTEREMQQHHCTEQILNEIIDKINAFQPAPRCRSRSRYN